MVFTVFTSIHTIGFVLIYSYAVAFEWDTHAVKYTGHMSLVFSVYTQAFTQVCKCTKKIQVTSGMFHSVPQESIA